MTITPAIKEALDEFARLSAAPLGPLEQDYRNVLSVVAAEDGRKYEELVKRVKEWQEAYEPFKHLPRPPVMTEQISRVLNAESALAQWKAK